MSLPFVPSSRCRPTSDSEVWSRTRYTVSRDVAVTRAEPKSRRCRRLRPLGGTFRDVMVETTRADGRTPPRSSTSSNSSNLVRCCTSRARRAELRGRRRVGDAGDVGRNESIPVVVVTATRRVQLVEDPFVKVLYNDAGSDYSLSTRRASSSCGIESKRYPLLALARGHGQLRRPGVGKDGQALPQYRRHGRL